MDDSLARGMAVSTPREGRACTKVFEDQDLLPLIFSYLAAQDVDRLVRPAPDSLPNDHTKIVEVVVGIDVRRLKVRAALDALPGVLRGMAALAAVCRAWRDHVSKGPVVAVQRLLGLPAKPSMLQLRADLLQVTRLRGTLAELAPVAFTESVIEEIQSPYDFPSYELKLQCNQIYDQIRLFAAEHPLNVREFKLDVDDPARASRLTQLLFRREGCRVSLPARDDVACREEGFPENFFTTGKDLVCIYSWGHDLFHMPYFADGDRMLPRMSEVRDHRQSVYFHSLMSAAARDPGDTDMSEWDLELEVAIVLTPVSMAGQSGITVVVQGWSRDYFPDQERPYFSNEEPYFEVTFSLPCLDDVRMRFRDRLRPSLRNAELTMAAPPTISRGPHVVTMAAPPNIA